MASHVKARDVLSQIEILIFGMSYQWHKSHQLIKCIKTIEVTVLNPKNIKLECIIAQMDLGLKPNPLIGKSLESTTTGISHE